VKVVAQAIPAYAMSVFRLPREFCHDVHSTVYRYWWVPKRDHIRFMRLENRSFAVPSWRVVLG